MNHGSQPDNPTPLRPPMSQDIDWYSKGQERIVEVNGVQVRVRFVGPNARRGRIAITAPAGAVFRDSRID